MSEIVSEPGTPVVEGQSKCEAPTGDAAGHESSDAQPLSQESCDSGRQTPEAPPSSNSDPAQAQDNFEIPDEDTVQRIVDQVEFYFSDANITKDAFLLKHVKRNKEGYVSLKLISSFKRVKHLAKDWRVVAYALKKSQKLEINEPGTKLRRKDPLPAFDQTAPSRTVVAINLPQDKTSIECVAELFKSSGEISLIRILRPGNPVPSDIRSFANKHPQMIGASCAVIEFVRTESAHNAVQKEWIRKDGEDFEVLQLNTPVNPEKKKKLKKSSRIYEQDYFSSCQSGSEAEDRKLRLQRRCSSPHLVHSEYARRWSRDSTTDSGSSDGRSRSGSRFYERRYSTDSEGYAPRSRSNSGVSTTDLRKFSIESVECCCRHRRGSRDSEGYCSARSRSNSGASIDSIGFRKTSLEWNSNYRPKDGRRLSQGEAGALIRYPRGPDGGRGFLPPQQLCHTLIE